MSCVRFSATGHAASPVFCYVSRFFPLYFQTTRFKQRLQLAEPLLATGGYFHCQNRFPIGLATCDSPAFHVCPDSRHEILDYRGCGRLNTDHLWPLGQEWFMWSMDAEGESILGGAPAIGALRDQIRHLASFDAPPALTVRRAT